MPLQAAGITFVPGVLENIVQQTHCYPFFTQVWGDCLARSLNQTGETEITAETIKAVEEEVITKRNAMYQVRRNEIKKMSLLPVAESVAEAFLQSGSLILHESTLEEAIESGLAGDEPTMNERVMKKLEQLFHLGYVWQVSGAYYEPGIPSLMTYVNNQIRSEHRN